MHDDPINWHGAFYDAIRLELEDYLDILTFEFEHQLNTDPLIIDALILKKRKPVVIEKNIAAIFKTTNIVEFKSPEDYLSISDFHKAVAYTHLYCATVQDAAITDITLTFVLTRRPRDVLNHIATDCKYPVTQKNPGIYQVTGSLFPIQIIETKRLSEDENMWLKDLHKGLEPRTLGKILQASHAYSNSDHIKAYLDAILKANYDAMEAIKMNETRKFYEALERMGVVAEFEARGIEKGIEKGREEGREEGIEKGLRLTATNLKKTGMPLKQIADVTGLPVAELEGL
ncbi:hypothetical protein AGMMS49942_22120 [Spirochaetia bacterium]|nr:hypothetical protein AGMMS49942_22120 [Spirochaetia bacterium]